MKPSESQNGPAERFAIGAHVRLRSNPHDGEGTIVATRGPEAKVYWDNHSTQWVNFDKLRGATNPTGEINGC